METKKDNKGSTIVDIIKLLLQKLIINVVFSENKGFYLKTEKRQILGPIVDVCTDFYCYGEHEIKKLQYFCSYVFMYSLGCKHYKAKSTVILMLYFLRIIDGFYLKNPKNKYSILLMSM